MKIRTLMIGTGTVLVLLAPTATAAPNKTVPRQGGGPQDPPEAVCDRQARTEERIDADPIYAAPFPPWPIVTPRHIYIAGFAGSASNVTEPDCASSYSNCTEQELRDTWGENYPRPVAQPPPVTLT